MENVYNHEIELSFYEQSPLFPQAIDAELSATDLSGSVSSTVIYSGNITSNEMRRSTGAEKYITNLKGVISVSFSVLTANVIKERQDLQSSLSQQR